MLRNLYALVLHRHAVCHDPLCMSITNDDPPKVTILIGLERLAKIAYLFITLA